MRVITSAAIIVTGTLFVYLFNLRDGVVTAKDTTMTFTTFVMFDMFNALTCRSDARSIFDIGFLSNPAFLYSVGGSMIGQLLVIYVPFFQSIFQTEALSLWDLLWILSLSSSVFWVDEARKKWLKVSRDKRVLTYYALDKLDIV
jgi:Ca2+-transporting ATPase